jgi:hypothetical protein
MERLSDLADDAEASGHEFEQLLGVPAHTPAVELAYRLFPAHRGNTNLAARFLTEAATHLLDVVSFAEAAFVQRAEGVVPI